MGELNTTPRYHQSAIDTFLRCGLQYEFRYVLGIRSPSSGAATLGRSFHTAIAKNLITKKENGVGCTLEEALDVFSSDFDDASKEAAFTEGEDKDELKDVGIQCVSLHHKEIAPTIDPDVIEERFIIDTDAGFSLGGTLDIVSKAGVIHDSKTSKTKYPDDAVSGAIQPAMYDFAYEALRGKKSTGFQYDVIVKTKTPKTQMVRGQVTQADREWLFQTLNSVHSAIKAGVFLPAQEDSWVCTKKYCGYWSRCKGKNR
jgi:CRISPR/Cas system-associated exonuclease Cas4 (RecB family)